MHPLLPSPPPLPASFTSLYRLTLRALSASVLNHRAAANSLRKHYRPVFERAAIAQRQIQENGSLSEEQRRDAMREWDERMDRTLEFLYSSATTSGRAHRLTRNLSFISSDNRGLFDPAVAMSRQSWKRWDGQKTEEKREAMLRPPKPNPNQKRLDGAVYKAVGEAMRMAEGKSRVVLGGLR